MFPVRFLLAQSLEFVNVPAHLENVVQTIIPSNLGSPLTLVPLIVQMVVVAVGGKHVSAGYLRQMLSC